MAGSATRPSVVGRVLGSRVGFAVSAVVMGAVFLLTRFAYLDWDVPPWSVSLYQPLDEAFYVWPAFNLADFGSWIHRVVPYVRNEAWPMNVAQNLVTWPMLRLFGDTLYGMRASSVLAGAGIAALTAVMVRRIGVSLGGSRRDARGPMLFWTAFLTLDFTFLIATRVVEPTIFRMLAVAALVVVLTQPAVVRAGHRVAGLVAGLASAAAVVWFYPHNAFVVLAAAIVIGIRVWPRGTRSILEATGTFALGLVASVGAWALFVYAIYGTGPLATVRYWLLNGYMSSDRNVVGTGLPNLAASLYANIFRFDWAFLFLLAVTLPVAAWVAFERLCSDDTSVVPLVFLASLGLQSLFVNDYPMRKLVIMLPLGVLVIATAWAGRSKIRHMLDSSSAARRLMVAWVTLTAAVVAVLALTLALPSLSGEMSTHGTMGALTGAGLAVAVAWVAVLLGNRQPLAVMLAPLLLVSLVIGSMWLDGRYVFSSPQFRYRDTCASLSPQFDGKLVAGGCSHAMRLYNTMEPILSGYRLGDDPDYVTRTLTRLVRDGKIAGSFAYDNHPTRTAMAAMGFVFAGDTQYITVSGARVGVWRLAKSPPSN